MLIHFLRVDSWNVPPGKYMSRFPCSGSQEGKWGQKGLINSATSVCHLSPDLSSSCSLQAWNFSDSESSR